MKPLIIALEGSHPIIERLAMHCQAEVGSMSVHEFPDGESLVRFHQDLKGRELVIIASLNQPNEKVLELIFAAATAKSLGAVSVGLCAPYLAYMRQDMAFNTGESITAQHFANLLSDYFDWLVTVDPHLHRFHSLDEIYAIPCRVVHAAPLIATWVRQQVRSPLLIGPDAESEQWVSEVALKARAPYIVLEKSRTGDESVEIDLPDMSAYASCTPVLVDDIVSSGHTLLEILEKLSNEACSQAICIAVHALFANDSCSTLAAKANKVISTNSIRHESNAIDVSESIASELKTVLKYD